MTRWNLPEEVAAAVRCHHNFSAAQPFMRLAAVVQLADVMAHELGDEGSRTAGLPPVAAPSMKLLGFGHDDFERLTRHTQADLARVDGLFDL